MIYSIVAIIFESFSSLFKSIDTFLNTRELTVGAILMGLAPFIVILNRITKEKEKRARAKRVELRQLRIESKIDDLMRDRGVVSTWSFPESGSINTVQMSLRQSLTTFIKAMFTKKLLSRRTKLMSISRKLVMMIFGAVIVVLNQQLGLHLDPDSIIGAGSLIISFIIGQSLVDTNGIGQYAPLLEKLKSKKLWVALVGSIIIVLNDTFKWGMDANSIYVLASIGVSFIVGKSAISVVKAKNDAGGTADAEFKTPVESTE